MIDPIEVKELCDSGHKLIRCEPGLYRCAYCRYELRLIEGD